MSVILNYQTNYPFYCLFFSYLLNKMYNSSYRNTYIFNSYIDINTFNTGEVFTLDFVARYQPYASDAFARYN